MYSQEELDRMPPELAALANSLKREKKEVKIEQRNLFPVEVPREPAETYLQRLYKANVEAGIYFYN